MEQKNMAAAATLEWVREDINGVSYEYLPLGEHVVAAKGVCGGRPTIKYRRLDARHILAFFERGDSVQRIATNYQLTIGAVEEIIRLASLFDYEKNYVKHVSDPD